MLKSIKFGYDVQPYMNSFNFNVFAFNRFFLNVIVTVIEF